LKWLLTGANGMLGTDVRQALEHAGHPVTAPPRTDLDITDAAACAEFVRGHDAVFNCAAWTAVDDAETHEAEAFAVNAVGAANLARAAQRHSGRMVHISTDYVFDGCATSPYDEDAQLAPRSAYGRTKAAGEWAVRAELPERHLILRTAWLYGAHGACFPKTITRLLRERRSISVVDDQLGQPTWTRDVADVALRLTGANASGTFHATASGSTTWHGLATAAAQASGVDPTTVMPARTSDFPRPARRPAYSVLGHRAYEAAAVPPIGHWRERWGVAAGEVLTND
jgi:dTDP-4-dehydrorhamnose reductase